MKEFRQFCKTRKNKINKKINWRDKNLRNSLNEFMIALIWKGRLHAVPGDQRGQFFKDLVIANLNIHTFGPSVENDLSLEVLACTYDRNAEQGSTWMDKKELTEKGAGKRRVFYSLSSINHGKTGPLEAGKEAAEVIDTYYFYIFI